MQYQLSEKERQILEHEFVYQDRIVDDERPQRWVFYEKMTYETTYRMPRKDGTWFWTVDKGKVIKTDDGRLAIISLCSDMTAFVSRKKELEKEHLISESMLSNLLGGYHRCAMEAGFPFLYIRACLKIHSRNLHAPIHGIFCPNSVAVARYAALIRSKSSANCDAHLAESIFQTHSSDRFLNVCG